MRFIAPSHHPIPAIFLLKTLCDILPHPLIYLTTNRKTAKTNINEHSSRSHAVVIITIFINNTQTGLRKAAQLYVMSPSKILRCQFSAFFFFSTISIRPFCLHPLVVAFTA